MKPLYFIAAASALAFWLGGTAQTAQANNAQAMWDLCHFPGHTVNDGLPFPYPKGDHTIGAGPRVNEAVCRERGGVVMTVGCLALKGHFPTDHDFIEFVCNFER